ncbi:hypothetical protein SOCEGT47_010480 [Sorangium cellulosum]|uniref:Uncharacterized protein n=1 Tax=Sorangium cellulosum TaxID=56 RepID=A0A4P2PVT4_SORCE|nr:hypothetical protein [Sorangium cellulosum]AUX20576.1 hypothetical protein SOCEGT47_010480 [Sorangium cellulosum]
MKLRSLTLDALTIDDERSFRHVALYGDLKQALLRDGYRFRVPEADASWDRVVFLNLTFWSASEQGDLIPGDHIAADVVAHVAWHHLAHRALSGAGAPPSAEALLLAEAIASAFDLYLVGRLLGHAPDAEFLATQVPAMAEAAEAAGLSDAAFEALLASVSADPERAFEDLRALLFDVTTALRPCDSLSRAAEILAGFDAHRFAPLLHHYELSNWILSTRPLPSSPDPGARAVDAALRSAPVALAWLEERWVRPPAPMPPTSSDGAPST